jgi:hypothetical protein
MSSTRFSGILLHLLLLLLLLLLKSGIYSRMSKMAASLLPLLQSVDYCQSKRRRLFKVFALAHVQALVLFLYRILGLVRAHRKITGGMRKVRCPSRLIQNWN